MIDRMHEANRAYWNAAYPGWKARKDATQNWRHAYDTPWNPLDRSGLRNLSTQMRQ